MPELKASSLMVGRKALHSKQGGSPTHRGGYSPTHRGLPGLANGSPGQRGYVPSQLESKPRQAFHVRTDWKAKYLK